jgi:hypothetical protein
VCTAFKNCTETQNSNKFNEHMINKDIARSGKKQDKIQATGHSETVTSETFDFQKILSTPYTHTSQYFTNIIYMKKNVRELTYYKNELRGLIEIIF